VTRKKLGENRGKKPVICLPFPVMILMNGWVWQVILPCYLGKYSLRTFFLVLQGFSDVLSILETGFKLLVIATVCSKMYSTKTGVVEHQETPQTSTKQNIKT